MESGGVDQDVGRVALAVLGDDGVGLDVVDARPDQLDVVPGQRAQPAPVVLQGALTGGRVVGDHLGDQLRIVTYLAGDPLGEHLAGELVGLADRPLRIGIVRVHPGRLPVPCRTRARRAGIGTTARRKAGV